MMGLVARVGAFTNPNSKHDTNPNANPNAQPGGNFNTTPRFSGTTLSKIELLQFFAGDEKDKERKRSGTA